VTVLADRIARIVSDYWHDDVCMSVCPVVCLTEITLHRRAQGQWG